MSKWTAASDVDYRNEVCGLSKAEEDLRLEREEEALREQRWAEFVAWVRANYEPPFAVSAAGLAMSGFPGSTEIVDFATEEGWPNVLRAIARAMEEEEQYRKELVDRR